LQQQLAEEIMKLHRNIKSLAHALAIGAASALLPIWAIAAEEKIFETNVTNDLNQSSGEPEIAVDPKNPRHLAIIEFGLGSEEAPAAVFNPQVDHDPVKTIAASKYGGRVMLSTDGGDHWTSAGSPASRPNSPSHGGGDPMIAIGPDGTIYAADEAGPAPGVTTNSAPVPGLPAGFPDLSAFSVLIVASTDGGKTFGAPQIVPTPVDRPWMTVDQSTGTVYTVSSGWLDVKTGKHNLPGPGAINDRWLVAWKPHLAAKSEPHRIGGPDFSGSGGNTITAAHGAIAATFVLGGPTGGFGGGPPAPVPVPDSIKGIIKDGTTSCSIQAPCLFFETSTDDGQHWTRHHVPVAGGFNGQHAQLSADPRRPGRYAIGVLNPNSTNFLVLVTDDSGTTWSGPVTVSETASGTDFKQWMAYGPTGVLGLTWRKERSDLPAPKPSQPQGPLEMLFNGRSPGYDVYAGISCDGGATWLPPVRVNTEPSLAGPVGRDDLGYIALDARYAHVVWGDRRLVEKAHNSPTGMGGIQAFYGRVPFSILSHGANCGRS
jgi:hypothetical protein